MAQIDFVGKLKKIAPERLIQKDNPDEADELFLALAYIYNDLKGISFFNQLLFETYRQPKPDETSYHVGEYSGLNLQLYRIAIATIHEFIDFLKKNKKKLYSGKFNLIKSRLPQNKQDEWNEIVNIALGKMPALTDFAKIILLIRNNISFHYSAKNLKNGYINHFFKKEKTELNRNQYAYYSLGETMAQTRFFYADAAAEAFMSNLAKNTSEINYQEIIMIVINNMNDTIYFLLKEYIDNCHKE